MSKNEMLMSVATFSSQCSANVLGRTLLQQRQLRDWFLVQSSFRFYFTKANGVILPRKGLHDASKGPISPLSLLVDNQHQISSLDIAIRVGRYSRNHRAQTSLIRTCVCFHRFLLETSLSAKTLQGNTGFEREIRKWFGVMASKSLLLEVTSVRGLLFTRTSVSANAASRTSSVTT